MPRKSLILCVDDEWNGLEGRKMLFEECGDLAQFIFRP
jgi:hypothetical protein